MSGAYDTPWRDYTSSIVDLDDQFRATQKMCRYDRVEGAFLPFMLDQQGFHFGGHKCFKPLFKPPK
jgi:hypothetical protein